MPTTADYLTQLERDRDNLADNLVTMGVQASQSETITELVPKVLDIQGGGSDFPTVSYTFENDFFDTSLKLFQDYVQQHMTKQNAYYYIKFVGNSTNDYYIRDMQTVWFTTYGTTYFFRYENNTVNQNLISSAFSAYVKAGTEMVIYTLTE